MNGEGMLKELEMHAKGMGRNRKEMFVNISQQ